jgi:glycerol-3-phosphate dehydrogenase
MSAWLPTIRRHNERTPHLPYPQGHTVTAQSSVDLLIIGGGINGTGIARDAVGRGLKVCLVEQDDLASHTSSAATKLIHGGFRYLEYYEFRLVREALIERERLLSIAPHIIWPMSFVLPHVPALRPRWLIRMGLFLYDHIGGRKRLPGTRRVRFDHDKKLGGPLQAALKHGFMFSDCWAQDSRLVVLNAMDAAEHGAQILTRTRLNSASADGSHWLAQCEDTVTGARQIIRARCIVNAAGSWVGDVINDRLHARSTKQVRLIKGSHIIIPRLYDGEHAYFLQNPDGRIEFVIPYEHNYTLIGTTDVPFTGDPSKVTISAEETTYLCESVNRYFNKKITASDVVWSYAGVRPLYDDAAASAAAVTRDYELEVSGDANSPLLLSVFGGKITTYRKLAESALEKLQPLLGGSTESWTGTTHLPGGDLPASKHPDKDFDQFVARTQSRWPFLLPANARRLARAYGTRVAHILGNAESMADLGEDFGCGLTRTEIDYLHDHEWARTAEDILWRRSKMGLHTPVDAHKKLEIYMQSKRPDRSRAAQRL